VFLMVQNFFSGCKSSEMLHFYSYQKYFSADNRATKTAWPPLVIGWASDIIETELNKDRPSWQSDFIAAFCSTNLGDVSPNIDGARCHYNGANIPINGKEGQMCDYERSTCPAQSLKHFAKF